MTLREALRARGIRPCDLIRMTGISKPTVYHAISEKNTKHKAGVRTGTLLAISKALNATIMVDEAMPDYYNVILKEVNKE